MKKVISRLSLTSIVWLLWGTATPNAQPAPNYSYIYGIGNDGALKWYRHTGAATGAGLETPGAWLGANEVGTGWNGFLSVFPGGLNTIYLIRADGRLEWRQHKGARDGLNQWEEGKTVGRGWNGFKQVFSVGGGIIYVIEPGGKLRWYKHNGYQTGASMETPGAWEGPKEVGRGWADFKQVFPGGNGIIYAITQDGKLRWYKHNGYLTGAGMETPGAWEGPNEVGRGWADFQNVFSAGNGIIYAITQEGKLIWYKHNGYLDGKGLDSPRAWENPKEIGRGWGDFLQVFALLPGSSPISRTPSSSSTSSNSDSASDGPGQPASRVPNVVGIHWTEAEDRLRKAGFKPFTLFTSEPDPALRYGYVKSTIPKAGTLASGIEVELHIPRAAHRMGIATIALSDFKRRAGFDLDEGRYAPIYGGADIVLVHRDHERLIDANGRTYYSGGGIYIEASDGSTLVQPSENSIVLGLGDLPTYSACEGAFKAAATSTNAGERDYYYHTSGVNISRQFDNGPTFCVHTSSQQLAVVRFRGSAEIGEDNYEFSYATFRVELNLDPGKANPLQRKRKLP